MKNVIFLCIILMSFSAEQIIFDFKNQSNVDKWYQTNDDVMGGVSNSKMILNDIGNGVFYGTVSTENNGGFAMTRLSVDIDLKKLSKNLILRVKGDGKKYQFRIKSKEYQKYWYVHSFQTSNKTEDIVIPLKDFFPSFRGNKLNLDNFNRKTIKEVAILIGNKKDEEFKLEIEKIFIK